MERYQYLAFISHSHKDKAWADWLHKKLESYKIPNTVKNDYAGRIPKQIRPIFLDKTDIGIGDLDRNLNKELSDSRFLIVICSPSAANPDSYVNKEVKDFISFQREDRIIPFIIDGTPQPKSEYEKQCYPPDLNKQILGASVKELTKEKAFIKVVAGLLGVKFDTLWQRHEKAERRKKRVRLFTIATIAFLLTISSLWVWNKYYRETVKYYADYVDRWGIPNGIIELSLKQVEKRRESYMLTYKAGKLISLKHINSSKSIIPHSNTEQTERPDQQVFFYTEKGVLESTQFLDNNGQVLIKSKYSGEKFDEIDFKDVKGKDAVLKSVTSGISVGLYQKEQYVSNGIINRYSLSRNEKGEIIKIIYKYGGLKEASDANGIFGKEFILDSLGRVNEVIFLNKKGEITTGFFNNAKKVYKYDIFGNIIMAEYRNKENKLALNQQGWAKVVNKADSITGNIIEESVLDANENACLDKNGISKYIIECDKQGNLSTLSFYDDIGKRCLNKNGYSIIKSKYDKNGYKVEESVYDKNIKPTLDNSGGVFIYRYERDKFGNQLVKKVFGIDSLPTLDKFGVHYRKGIYNEKGKLIEMSFYDKQNKLCLSKDGNAKFTIKYDENGNQIEVAYYGTDNKLKVLQQNGMARLVLKYDNRNNLIMQSFFDEKGNITISRDGYAKDSLEYDETGNPIKETYYNNNNICSYNKNGVAKIISKYDEAGNQIEATFYGINSEKVSSKLGYHIMTNKYDANNRLEEVMFKDTNAKPCFSNQVGFISQTLAYYEVGKIREVNYSDGYGNSSNNIYGVAKLIYKYDKRGNVVEEACFNNRGERSIGKVGYSIMKRKYNDKDSLNEVSFYGINEKLITANQGAAIQKFTYDDRGNNLTKSNYGIDSLPCVDKAGVFTYYMEYDERDFLNKIYEKSINGEIVLNNGIASQKNLNDEMGNQIEISYFDLTNKLSNNNNGFAKQKIIYSPKGKVVKVAFFDSNDKPCMTKVGCVIVKIEYDEMGNTIEYQMLNEKGDRCSYNGISFVKLKYNNLGEEILKTFYDINGNIIQPKF